MTTSSTEITTIKINLENVETEDQLFDALDKAFGFVDWFGRNFNALADCLFTFYFKEESLCEISNENGGETILEIKIKPGSDKKIIYLADLLSYVNLKLSETDVSGRFSLRPIID